MDFQKIREHWDDQARKFGTSPKASWVDLLLYKEIRTVCRFIRDDSILLDAGCANGFSSIAIVKRRRGIIHGIDYSWEMICQARRALAIEPSSLQDRVTFSLADVRVLPFPNGSFDTVLSKRCITNLNTREFQDAALTGFYQVLKKGGTLLLSEPTLEGLARLNQVRMLFRLPKLSPPWHNLYLDEGHFQDFIRDQFRLLRVVDFSSTYYAGSRVIYPFLVRNDAKKIHHDSFLNKIFLLLPNFGDYGVQKLFVLQRC